MDSNTCSQTTDSKLIKSLGLWKGLTQCDLSGGVKTMAECLKLGLEKNEAFSSQDVFEGYFRRWTEKPYDAGPTVQRVFELVQGGISPALAADIVHHEAGGLTAGCNPAHRVSVMATMPFLETSALADLARADAKLTHLHEDAGEASAAMVLLCRHLLNGVEWLEATEQSAKEISGPSKIALLSPDDRPLDKCGYAPEVLRAAVAIVQMSSDFESAISSSFKFSYPSSYCPILVGALAGARWGAVEVDATASKF